MGVMRCAVQAKSTGQLSVVTYAFNVVGCLARMYTSHAEGGGFAMIRGFALGASARPVPQTAVLSCGSAFRRRHPSQPIAPIST